MVDAVKAALVQRYPEQDGNNALCHLKNMDAAFLCAAAEIVFINGLAVFQHDHTCYVVVIRRDSGFHFRYFFFFHISSFRTHLRAHLCLIFPITHLAKRITPAITEALAAETATAASASGIASSFAAMPKKEAIPLADP